MPIFSSIRPFHKRIKTFSEQKHCRKISFKELSHFLNRTILLPHLNKPIPFPQQSYTIPWKSLINSPPVWAIVVAQFTFDWQYYTLLICLPMFFSDVLRFDIAQVRISVWECKLLSTDKGGATVWIIFVSKAWSVLYKENILHGCN